jgi:hypothetical protein
MSTPSSPTVPGKNSSIRNLVTMWERTNSGSNLIPPTSPKVRSNTTIGNTTFSHNLAHSSPVPTGKDSSTVQISIESPKNPPPPPPTKFTKGTACFFFF